MVSTAVISHYLKNLDFPASRQKCVDYARQHNAPREVLEALQNMPVDNFDSMAGIWKAIGEEHREGRMPGPIPKR